ncbi:hypothetical protein E2C01_051658 [Portunus trituberculatus]|uniref:Uncharacterized protein n=1 Tax=Portunus trituberculatus TaxID=210409 RepID=A0A5B7GJP1_PORTR|nr:hypothetical protein [Portunus trituberculatus]
MLVSVHDFHTTESEGKPLSATGYQELHNWISKLTEENKQQQFIKSLLCYSITRRCTDYC